MASFENIKHVGVIGAGTMGRGIVMNFINAGYPVTWLDVNGEMLDKGVDEIRNVYKRSVAQQRFDEAEAKARVDRVSTTQDYNDLNDMDLVVEAVYENMDLKKKIFGDLDKAVKQDAILATNTSYLDIDEIASATQRPSQVLGLHFFSPAHIMKLLEVVRGKATAQDVMDTCLAVGKKIGKEAVLAGNCHGFIGNRMLEKYSRQARLLMLEGATPWQIDTALQGFGMAMGPYRMYDVVGVDLGWRSRQLAGVGRGEPVVWLDNKLCEMGRFGQKSGHGFYKYEPGSRQAIHDPETDMMAREVAEEAGYTQRDIGDEEIVERCILALVNEGARILDEGFAESAEDIDRVYRFGYGFPAERGGPMAYADSLGLDKVLAKIREFESDQGDFWKPAAGLVKRAEAGERFTKA
ncbi:3-hydroxyacyl-CoA dehydrogenase [Halopseudomonas xinjiangensis]|uniref:3-hydroxyacyl-CoA dehydrogenase n=1 Tax=Halopseudomonas xinjiangensis TaxID=487184 RepID=A0A1H1ULL0_9GAMM|nr:3-hydroxyacyl-CoA dehydrogenase [Halopseudomonas xinjiangensis]SDS73353.1 3-hydroxyacyl-CoA dehydrogenase [Halopseudomonas xinjiangensis]